MISHIVKKMLDEVTGLTFQPIHSDKAWYSLTPIQRDYINVDMLKVESLINKQHESNHLKDGYSLRFSVSGGGILPLQDFELYDSTQYLQITWYRKRG